MPSEEKQEKLSTEGCDRLYRRTNPQPTRQVQLANVTATATTFPSLQFKSPVRSSQQTIENHSDLLPFLQQLDACLSHKQLRQRLTELQRQHAE